MDAPPASVPVIDLSGFIGGDAHRRRSLGEQIDRACREVGFFTVVGHGVPDATIAALTVAARRRSTRRPRPAAT